ncbi:hypothetical protein Hanom_Chr17g01549751 [Helianthus anomalus]
MPAIETKAPEAPSSHQLVLATKSPTQTANTRTNKWPTTASPATILHQSPPSIAASINPTCYHPSSTIVAHPMHLDLISFINLQPSS